MNESL